MVYYFEGSQILAPLRITSNSPVYEAETVSLKRVRASQEAQRWEMSFEVLTADNAVDLLIAGITDPHISKTMVMPQIEETSAFTVSLVVNGAGGVAGASSIVMNGAGTLAKGRFITFSDHAKVYIVTADTVISNGVSLPLFPALRSSVAAGTVLNISPSISYHRDNSDIQGITFQDGVLASPGSISIVEAL